MLQYLEIPVEKSTINKTDHVIAVLNGDSDAKVCRPVGDSSDTSKYELLSTDDSLLERWPRTGSIEFRNVWMNYRSNPSVLRGISFKICYGERIGVCGRTGAGKVRASYYTYVMLFWMDEWMDG
jgi:ABC-type multidrug transport system fused ATPase/permease subunit